MDPSWEPDILPYTKPIGNHVVATPSVTQQQTGETSFLCASWNLDLKHKFVGFGAIAAAIYGSRHPQVGMNHDPDVPNVWIIYLHLTYKFNTINASKYSLHGAFGWCCSPCVLLKKIHFLTNDYDEMVDGRFLFFCGCVFSFNGWCARQETWIIFNHLVSWLRSRTPQGANEKAMVFWDNISCWVWLEDGNLEA